MFFRLTLLVVLLQAGLLASDSVVASAAQQPGPALELGFANPPEETKPWCYWYWISDNVSKEGITRDLEAMARVGIGEAFIGNIFLDDTKPGPVKVLSEEWWRLVEHAIREGGRTGVNIGMFNCPGWSQSGGPWIKPGDSMRYLVSSEVRVQGPARFEQKLVQPKEQFQDVTVLAFPAPLDDTNSIRHCLVRTMSTPEMAGLDLAFDGKPGTVVIFPPGTGEGDKTLAIDMVADRSFTARSLSLTPGESGWAAQGELQAEEDGSFRTMRRFKIDRSNMEINVGFMPRGPVTVVFPAVTSKRFRLVLKGIQGHAALAEIELTGAVRLESYVEKQLGKMHPTPLPMWDTYLWPTQPEETPAGKGPRSVPLSAVQNLSARMGKDGILRWDVPPGEWIILRTGMAPTGTRNAPASPEGQGLEVDKMNRAAAKRHFAAFIGQVLRRIPAADRKAFKHVVADSYEMGSQNWTDGFETTFCKRYGYDPIPWLPVLTGRVVGSVDESDRFLWDLRRLTADHVASDYVGGLREECRPHGLQLWLENYGHWGFPAEFLQYGGQSDCVGGEYWVTGDLGSIECRAASSCGNTYGKPRVSAESFTGGPAFQTAPWGLKTRGDWAFCEGINHFVLHVCIQQPWEDKVPGINAWFGTEFNRHNTWFEPGKAWIEYLRRCCFLLQQGWRVADVAYFIGEDAPKMTGIRQPELPPGYDFDYINAEVILNKLSVEKGRLTLPHGTSYRVLVLPELATIRPEVLRKVLTLVKGGATVVGTPPSRSPSMEDYPACDQEVLKLARDLWGKAATGASGERRFPAGGRVIWGKNLKAVFAEIGVAPDFQSDRTLRFTHRSAESAQIYFVANPKAEDVTTTATFRADGWAPELWWPESGRIERPAVFDLKDGTVRLPLNFAPNESVFVVFRERAVYAGERIVSVSRNGETVLDTRSGPMTQAYAASGPTTAGSFAMAVWANPAQDTALLPEANTGVHGMGDKRNDALFPPHGNTFGTGTHAGCGLAIGRNGVVVYEHGGNYFAPILVYPVSITDWTHVAVVYRDGLPKLYLNGVFAHQGLQTSFIVHPGPVSGASGNPQFRGKLGSFQTLGRAPGDSELSGWIKSMPRPVNEFTRPAIALTRTTDQHLVAQIAQPGSYVLRAADGRARTIEVGSLPAPISLPGPWEVRFTPGWTANERVTFDRLADWTQRPEPDIKYYSGKGVYRTVFALPSSIVPGERSRIILDLGEVRDIATLRLNGKEIGALWTPPWRVAITGLVKPGENVLEVEVVNCWNNRLVGDQTLPATQRRTFTLVPTVSKDAPLLPAGLLGPVTLEVAEQIDLKN